MNKKLLLLLGVFVVTSLSAKTIYVKDGEFSDAWSDKDDVYLSLGEAYAVAEDFDEIWISGGTYTLTAQLKITKAVSIYGSFKGDEKAATERARIKDGKLWEFVNPTIIEKDGSYTTAEGMINLQVNLKAPIVIDGVTIQKNNFVAVQMRNTLTIQNCILRDNYNPSTGTMGGAINFYKGGTIKDSYLYNNRSPRAGGIYGNNPDPGAGVVNPSETIHIENVTFDSNVATTGWATWGGGALSVCHNMIVNNCTFINNKTQSPTDPTSFGKGAAFEIWGTASLVSNCLIYNNRGENIISQRGGTIINCVVANNEGKFIVNFHERFPSTLANCVLWGNKVTSGAIIETQSGMAADTYGIYSVASDLPMVKATNDLGEAILRPEALFLDTLHIEKANTGAVGNYAKFISPSTFVGVTEVDADRKALYAADWNIADGSFLIDRGNNTIFELAKKLSPLTKDFAGNDRVKGAKVDIGAYESLSGSSITTLSKEATFAVTTEANRLTVSGAIEGCKVEMFDISGQLLFSQMATGAELSIPVAARGIYILRVASSNGMATQKVSL